MLTSGLLVGGTRLRGWLRLKPLQRPRAGPEARAPGVLPWRQERSPRSPARTRDAERQRGHEPPTNQEGVRAVLPGIRRTIGAAREGKAPATADVLKQMLALCPDTLTGKRDRALLALGFAGAFRRSELVALEVADLTEVPDGLRRSAAARPTQEGEGAEVAIPRGGYRQPPVEAVQAWLAAAGMGLKAGASNRGRLLAISAAVAETTLLARSVSCGAAIGTTPEAQPKQWSLPADRVPLPELQYLGAGGDQIYLTDWARHS
jgi:integrase